MRIDRISSGEILDLRSGITHCHLDGMHTQAQGKNFI